MKIEVLKEDNTVLLSELKPGDIFEWYNDYYIKTSSTYKHELASVRMYGCVNLSTGNERAFDDEYAVTPVLNAKVVIG